MRIDDDLWDAEAFTALGIALHGNTRGWAVAMAERLGIEKRAIYRWSREGAPLRIKFELMAMAGIIDETAFVWPRDRWISAEGPVGTYRQPRKRYLMHTQFPRFIARVITMGEHPADLSTGAVYHVDRDTVLAEINWIDVMPRGKNVGKLLEAAGVFFKTLLRSAQGKDDLRWKYDIDEARKIAFPRDEWIVGDTQAGPVGDYYTGREYIIHTRAPRFIARIVTIDDGRCIPSEDPVDILSGVTYVMDDDDMFCEIQWIDARPSGEERADLLLMAWNALDWWAQSDPKDTGMRIH